MTMLRSLLLLPCLLPVFAGAQVATPAPVECVVPSKPGGAMDLTCKLAKKGLAQEGVAAAAGPLRISYLPGGIGAVAWHSMGSQRRRAEANTLVAFSGGSLLHQLCATPVPNLRIARQYPINATAASIPPATPIQAKPK